MHSCKWRRLRDRFGSTAAVGNARERMSACSRYALTADVAVSASHGRFAPIAAVRTRGTVSPKRSFAGAAANDRVGWIPAFHA